MFRMSVMEDLGRSGDLRHTQRDRMIPIVTWVVYHYSIPPVAVFARQLLFAGDVYNLGDTRPHFPSTVLVHANNIAIFASIGSFLAILLCLTVRHVFLLLDPRVCPHQRM